MTRALTHTEVATALDQLWALAHHGDPRLWRGIAQLIHLAHTHTAALTHAMTAAAYGPGRSEVPTIATTRRGLEARLSKHGDILANDPEVRRLRQVERTWRADLYRLTARWADDLARTTSTDAA